MADNIVRIVFDDSGSSSDGSNASPVNNGGVNASEELLNDLSAKVKQFAEITNTLNTQNKVNYENLKKAGSKVDSTLDPKSVKDFNKTLKDASQDNIAITKQYKELTKSLGEFQKKLKEGNDGNDDTGKKSNNKSDATNNTLSTLAKAAITGKFFYNGSEAFKNYAAINALDNGNDMMNPVDYASQRRDLQFGEHKNIVSLLGGAVGLIAGHGNSYIAYAASQAASLAYDYIGGENNAKDKLQYKVSQNYTDLTRGNNLSKQIAPLYANQYINPDAHSLLLSQLLQMPNMNQFGGNPTKDDLYGIANISKKYNANPAQVGSLIAQINTSVKNMPELLKQINDHADKTGGDIVAQLASAVNLMQKGGLSAPEAISKAFSQSLYGSTYANAQDNYFQKSYAEQYRLRMLGKIAGVDVEGVMNNDPKAIKEFNKKQAYAAAHRLNGDANTYIINNLAQMLGVANGKINSNLANKGNASSLDDTYGRVSNAESEQLKNAKNLGIKNLNDLNGKLNPHNMIREHLAKFSTGLKDQKLQETEEAKQKMTADRQTGNIEDYHHQEQLIQSNHGVIKALDRNTKALQKGRSWL